MVDALFKSPKFLKDVAGIIKIVRALKPMVPKRSWMVPHHKVVLAEIGPKKMSTSSLAHYTKAKHAHAADGMLKCGFMLSRQIMLVPQT